MIFLAKNKYSSSEALHIKMKKMDMLKKLERLEKMEMLERL